MPRLSRSDPTRPGIHRQRAEVGFRYVHANGRTVRDVATIRRIEQLAIPPAWMDVWICSAEHGHLQAVGTDQAGRRQYRYHDAFIARRAARKWQRVERFGARLHELRGHVAQLLDQADGAIAGPDEAAAWCVHLLDRSLIRVGSVEYQRRNGTYGLCTLQRRHVDLDGDAVTLSFVGKHGLRHAVTIVDGSLSSALGVVVAERGTSAPLLGWRDGRRWRTLTPAAVNRFIATHLPGATAKDFRTWHASVLTAAGLVFEQRRAPDLPRERIVSRTVEQVALLLGNTPAVTRSSYVHPGIVDRWLDGSDIAPALDVAARYEDLTRPALRDVAERALLDLLADRTPRTMRSHARDELERASA
jgi:DNA topoisomerase I